MTFWIVTFALALMVSALLILVLIRGGGGKTGDGADGGLAAGVEPAAAFDLQVYRDQLRDVDRDLTRGVIGKQDAERVRIEISRRILAADARVQDATPRQDQPRGPAWVMAVVLAVVVIAGSVVLYRGLGAPGYGDLSLSRRIDLATQARETRPSQEQAEAQLPPAQPADLDAGYKALIDQLRAKVASHPGDLQGQVLLAHHEAKSGDFVAAHRAQAQVIALMGDTAGAREQAEYGELLIVAAGGYVSPEAETALRTALEQEPDQGPSRYYWGLMLGQTGRPDLAFRVWERTLRRGPADAPWLAPIRGQIEEMAWRAGVEYTLPDPPSVAPPLAPPLAPALAGPSAGDVAAAADMSAEDRQALIRSMVERLSGRLADEGGSPAEWARLIGALGVLGDATRAQTIYDEAQTKFAGNETALSELASAARRAGLTP